MNVNYTKDNVVVTYTLDEYAVLEGFIREQIASLRVMLEMIKLSKDEIETYEYQVQRYNQLANMFMPHSVITEDSPEYTREDFKRDFLGKKGQH